jgi:NADH dehydrogenase FAD-containing subunit
MKSAWQHKGRDACGELLKEADEALKRAREQEAAETRLKIMEDGKDELINMADTIQDKAEERFQDELIEMSNEVLHKKENMLTMAQMLQGLTIQTY